MKTFQAIVKLRFRNITFTTNSRKYGHKTRKKTSKTGGINPDIKAT